MKKLLAIAILASIFTVGVSVVKQAEDVPIGPKSVQVAEIVPIWPSSVLNVN